MNDVETLRGLVARMTEVVIQEADPSNWPGAGKAANEMDAKERGDRYWCKKNANQAITTAVKLETLLNLVEQRHNGQVSEDTVLKTEKAVIDYEAKAKQRLEQSLSSKALASEVSDLE